MQWKRIRLVLDQTPEFPAGSASRAYLVQLPVKEDGLVDTAILETALHRARIRRHWPNEADRSGSITRTTSGWGFAHGAQEEGGRPIFHLETQRLCVGESITLTEPDGRQQTYRVVSVS
jgi:hypothetical protein